MDFKESLENIREKQAIMDKMDSEIVEIKEHIGDYILDTFRTIRVQTSNEEIGLDELVTKIIILGECSLITIYLNPRYYFVIPKELYELFDCGISIKTNARDGLSLILDYEDV